MARFHEVSAMKKKIIGLLLAFALVLSMPLCVFAEVVEEYNGVTAEELQSALESFHQQCMQYSDEDLDSMVQTYKENGMEEFGQYYENVKEVNDFLKDAETKDFVMETLEDDSEGALQMTLTLDGGEKGEYALKMVLDENLQTIVSFVYESTEKPSMGALMGKAGLNTLLGMGIVFAVLILISILISLFKYLPGSGAKKQKEAETTSVQAPDAALAQKSLEAPAVQTDDKELIAVITAAVAAAMGTTATDGFVVRSIKKRKW